MLNRLNMSKARSGYYQDMIERVTLAGHKAVVFAKKVI
jgi:hypothetical protein